MKSPVTYDTTKVRKCGKHGFLPIEQFKKSYCVKNGKKYDVYKCHTCMMERGRKQYKKNPVARMDSTRKWRETNKDVVNKIANRTYHRHKGKYLEAARADREERRLGVLRHYSGDSDPFCVACGEKRHEFLVIDHIDGGGTQHRKSMKKLGSNFYTWLINEKYPEGYRVLCQGCNIKFGRGRIPGKENAGKRLRDVRRDKCFEHYGRACACCGKDDPVLLNIDHISGNGNQHRKETGEGSSFYKWLVANNFPEGFRTLCWNCNFAMGVHGKCPHQEPA